MTDSDFAIMAVIAMLYDKYHKIDQLDLLERVETALDEKERQVVLVK